MLLAVFLQAFIIAPLFLDMCLKVFGVLINPKNIFDCDILLENRDFFFIKIWVLTQKHCLYHGQNFHLQPLFIH